MGISIWQLLIILTIIILLFGTKRIRNIGQDLGSCIQSFRNAKDTSKDKDSAIGQVGENTNQSAQPHEQNYEDSRG